jgi:hypothetical protein
MEIDKDVLIKLLESFVDTSEVLQREMVLYQMLFSSACKARGLSAAQAQKAVEQGRELLAPKIRDAFYFSNLQNPVTANSTIPN